MEAAGRYVLSRRTAGGGYCYYRAPQWGVDEANAPDTLAAVGSLRILGMDPPEPEATGRWLCALQSADGSYSTLTIGWAALRALELLGAEPDHCPRDWLKTRTRLLLGRHGLREWRGALLDVQRLLELSQLTDVELSADQRDNMARMLAEAADRFGGAWARPGADLESTAVAVRLIELGNLPGDGEKASEDFLRDCEDANLGLRLAPDTAMTSVGASGRAYPRIRPPASQCAIRGRSPRISSFCSALMVVSGRVIGRSPPCTTPGSGFGPRAYWNSNRRNGHESVCALLRGGRHRGCADGGR
jgi:hypothetical protein